MVQLQTRARRLRRHRTRGPLLPAGRGVAVMIPLRFQYFFFPIFAILVTAALWRQPWALLFIWITLGALQAFLYGLQLRRDLQFARGCRRARRTYRIAVRTVANGYIPISGRGRCLIYFTGRHHRGS